mgnify:CR=1 FL=1
MASDAKYCYVGRRRTRDKDLPERVYRRGRALYYVHRDGRWENLGRDLHTALLRYSCIVDPPANTMAALFRRYALEVIPTKSDRSQKDNRKEIERLRKAVGHMAPAQLTSRHVYKILDTIGQRSHVQANRHISLLSDVCRQAIRWGEMDQNPCIGIQRFSIEPRERYVEDAELAEVYERASDRMRVVIGLALLVGLRRTDICELTWDDVTDAGILVRPSKGRRQRKKVLVQWSPALQHIVEIARKIEPRVRRHVLCTLEGEAYTPDGLSKQWQRLRAGFTMRHYRRKLETVRPLR